MISDYWVVVPAAGSGRRMGASRPKQYLPMLGRPLLTHTLHNILSWPGLAGVVVALAPDDDWFSHLPQANHPLLHTVTGGAERADSVLAALDYLAEKLPQDMPVLVHDAARPCVPEKDVVALLSAQPLALLAQPASDTVKLASEGDPSVERTLDRNRIWLAQTPQKAPLELLRRCLREGLARNAPVTDEASALELAGHSPQLVEGSRENLKVTHPSDLWLAEAILRLRYADAQLEDKSP